MKLLDINNSVTHHGNKVEAPAVHKFLDMDDEKRFNKNKKYFKKHKHGNWRYINEEINYTINSQKYRCPEFSEIHWHESILFFGCSHMFGIGVDDRYTIPNFVEQKTGIKCVNLGIPGSSLMAQIHNAEVLHHHNVEPRGVVILYPESTRYTLFSPEQNLHLGPWNLDDSSFISRDTARFLKVLLKEDQHLNTLQRWNQRLFKSFWDCPVFDFVQYHKKDDLKRFSKKIPKALNYHDKARDFAHAGPISNEKAAEDIIKIMKTRNFL